MIFNILDIFKNFLLLKFVMINKIMIFLMKG